MEQKDFRLQHLSVSAIEMFVRCEAAYFFRYVEGLKIPPASALTFGGSFDDGITANYAFKKVKEKDLPVKEVQEIFAAAFEKRSEETEWKPGENKDDMKDEGVRGIEVFHSEICPNVHPVEVQEKINLEFENSSVSFLGFIDTEEKNGTLSDTKTAGRIWPAGSEFQKFQPVAYSLLKDKDSERERQFRFDILVRTKKPKVQQLPLTITKPMRMSFLQYTAQVLSKIQEAIKTGVFLPRRDHFLCSRKYCGFHEQCQKTWGFKIKD